MPDPEMAAAHKRDSHDLDRIRALQHAITAFTAEPPAKAHPKTLEALKRAVAALKADADHVVAVWD